MRRGGGSEQAPKPLQALVEEARLAVLEQYRALSAEGVEGLWRVSRETAQSLGATQASVSFVDSARVWFGGAFGFDAHDVAREGSFCDAVVRSGAVLVVPDAVADPRFWNHDMVRSRPGLRSYAGVPLVDGGGYTLGTVAVYSVSPARFTSAVLPNLTGIATLVRDFLADACRPATPRYEPAPTAPVQGWLGVKALEAKAGEGGGAGLVVLSVKPGSPAATSGLRPTDIIYSIGGAELRAQSDIKTAMAGRTVGSRVSVKFRRALAWHECEVEIRTRRRRFGGR